MWESKNVYVCSLEMYAVANPADTDFNSSINVIDRICSMVKNSGHSNYMDRWFSNPKLSDHLWAWDKKADTLTCPKEKCLSRHFPRN
jgi:hypothetical protein